MDDKKELFGGFRLGADPETDRAIQSAGGKARQQQAAKRKTMQQAMQEALAAAAPADLLAKLGLQAESKDGSKKTMLDCIVAAQAVKGAAGDTDAARFCRDSAGDKVADAVTVAAEVTTAADIAIQQAVARRLGLDAGEDATGEK